MNITVNDSRKLAVAVVNVSNGQFYNWTGGQFESPFVSTHHLKGLTTVPNLPSGFTVQNAFVQDVLLNYVNVAAVLATVDPSGNPIGSVDVWTQPFPLSCPVAGGFNR